MTENNTGALVVDIDKLTVGDLEDFEEIVGVPFFEAFQNAKKDGSGVDLKALKAIIYIVRRQDDPDFTLEDARKVRLSEFEIASEPDPQNAVSVS